MLIRDPLVLVEFLVQHFCIGCGGSDEVSQLAFLDQFARASPDWQSIWVSELQKLVGKD